MKKPLLFYLQLSFTIIVCVFLIAPVIQSILIGISNNALKGLRAGVTLKWIIQVWDIYSGTIFLSLIIAFSCLIINLVVGIPAAYALAKKPSAFSRMFEEFLVLPLAVPGLSIALAIIITYGSFEDFRRSWLFILVGHVVYTLPFMVRSVLAILKQIDFATLEEGAASLGAKFYRRFFQIIIPNCKTGIINGAVTVLTLSIGEFNLTWLLHTPFTKTLPVGLADSYASLRLEVGSAYTIIFFLLLLPFLIVSQMSIKKKYS